MLSSNKKSRRKLQNSSGVEFGLIVVMVLDWDMRGTHDVLCVFPPTWGWTLLEVRYFWLIANQSTGTSSKVTLATSCTHLVYLRILSFLLAVYVEFRPSPQKETLGVEVFGNLVDNRDHPDLWAYWKLMIVALSKHGSQRVSQSKKKNVCTLWIWL